MIKVLYYKILNQAKDLKLFKKLIQNKQSIILAKLYNILDKITPVIELWVQKMYYKMKTYNLKNKLKNITHLKK